MYLHIVFDGVMRRHVLFQIAKPIYNHGSLCMYLQQFGEFKLDMSWKIFHFPACSGDFGSIRHCSGSKVPGQAGVYKIMDVVSRRQDDHIPSPWLDLDDIRCYH
jgi:hypothetical protein